MSGNNTVRELRRLAYLDALGIESYVSRRQLPCAAPTRRLALVRNIPPVVTPDIPAAPPVREAPSFPRVDSVPSIAVEAGKPKRDSVPPEATAGDDAGVQHSVPRFSLCVMVAGAWLWLEELDGMPLTVDQVRLVQSMARAMLHARNQLASTAPSRPAIAQFDWPIHNNRQLDQGEAAAQAGLASFIGRKLEEHGSKGVVLMGRSCEARVPELDVSVARIASSAEMLDQSVLKTAAWRELLSLAGRP